MELDHAILDTGQTRVRQIFLTGLSACIGLAPAAMSEAIGSQVRQPLACVIVGGMLLSPIFSLFVLPVFAKLFIRTGTTAPKASTVPTHPPGTCPNSCVIFGHV